MLVPSVATPSSAAKVKSPTCSTVIAKFGDSILGPSLGPVSPTAYTIPPAPIVRGLDCNYGLYNWVTYLYGATPA